MNETSRIPSSGSGEPRYASLRDYLHVVRRHRLLIALVTLTFAGAALGLSLTQEPTYETSARLSFRDIVQDLTLLGGGGVPEEAPSERAAANAEFVTGPAVTRRVEKDLKPNISPGQGSVEAHVGVETNLVVVEASAAEPELAARLANSYARQAKIVATRAELERLEEAEKSILRQVEEARDGGPEDTSFQLGVLEQQLSRVQTLKEIATPVEIARRAGVPGSPVSPNPVRNTILGGLVGLVFGLLGAFVRDSLDRRLHNAQEIHQELGLPVLGQIGESALGYAGLARNGPVTMTEADFEAFRVLRTNLAFLSSGGPVRSILVTSGLPEEGKSTVSISLASAAAVAGQRTLLVECDLRRPIFASRMGIETSPGLTDYVLGRAVADEIVQTVELREPRSVKLEGDGPDEGTSAAPLACIVSGSTVPRPAELLLGNRFRDLLASMTGSYDLVVLDTSPLLAVVDALQIVPQVDGVILCVRARRTTREQARATKTALGHLPERPTGAVVTGLRRGGPEGYDYYYHRYYER